MNEQLIEDFQRVEDIFSDALVSNDANRISNHISDDWILLEPQYGIVPKNKFLNAIEVGELMHMSMKKKVLRVHIYNDVALVVARGMNVGNFRTQPFNAEHWVTNIYKKKSECWICVMLQESPVICK